MPFLIRNLFFTALCHLFLAITICSAQTDVNQLLDQRQYRTAQQILRNQAFQCLTDKDTVCAFDRLVRIPEIEAYETWEAYSFPEIQIKPDLQWALSFIKDTIYPQVGNAVDLYPQIKFRLLLVEGICLHANNKLLEALSRLEEARQLAASEHGENSLQMAIVYEWLGTTYAFNIERSTLAREMLQKSYELLLRSPRADSLKMRGHILYGLAYAGGKLYQSEQARAYIEEAREIYNELGLPKEVSHCDNILGEYYMLNGQLDSARMAYQRSLDQMSALGVPANMVIPHINLANWYLMQAENKSNARQALYHLEEANQIYYSDPSISVNPQIDAWIPTNFARYYFIQGKTEEALQYIERSVSLSESRLGARHFTTMALISRAAEEFSKREMHETALQYCDQMARTISNKAQPGNNAGSDNWPIQDSVFALIQYWFTTGRVLDRQAAALNDDRKTLEQALQAYQNGHKTLRDARSMLRGEESKANLSARFAPFFHRAINVGYKLYRSTKDPRYLPVCFELMEANKYLSVFDAAQQASFNAPDESQLQRLVEQVDSVEFRLKELKRLLSSSEPDRQQIQNWKKERSDLEYQRERLNNSLNAIYPDYHNLAYDSLFISMEEVGQRLPEKTQLIEFLATERYYFALSISSRDHNLIRIDRDDADSIDHSINVLINMLRSDSIYQDQQDVVRYNHHAYNLYDRLLAPIVKEERLIVVPDGKLMYLPFEVLVKSKATESPSFESLDYIIRDHAVSYALSTNLLFSDWRTKPQVIRKAAAFAYADIVKPKQVVIDRGNDFPELMFADEELAEVSSYFGSNCTTYLGNTARKGALFKELPSADLIHLAIHGQADEDNLENSRLVFPGEKGLPESMFSYELYPQTINSKMVVLSACESGLGKNLAGEGLFSMARAFIYAGCPSVVMSLWNVNDRAGFEIIRNFYQGLSREMPISRSMQQAKLKYLDANSGFDAFPRFWGAITLTGVDQKFKFDRSELGITEAIVLGMLGLVLIIIMITRYRRNRAN